MKPWPIVSVKLVKSFTLIGEPGGEQKQGGQLQCVSF